MTQLIFCGGARDDFQVTLDWAKDKDSVKPEDEAKQLPILQIQNPNGRRASSGQLKKMKNHDFRKFQIFDKK